MLIPITVIKINVLKKLPWQQEGSLATQMTDSSQLQNVSSDLKHRLTQEVTLRNLDLILIN